MKWDEKAEDSAGRWPTDPEHGDCLKCQINEQVREGFIMGAKWQRDQLRTDEAIERVAQAIGEWEPDDWDNPEFREYRSSWTDEARTAIDALLGEDQ